MLPSGYTERPAGQDDLREVTELLIATDIAEYGEPDWSEADQIEEWANPRLDLSRDTRLVQDDDGTTIAYAYVTCRDDGADFDSDVYVHPAYDELGIEEHLMGVLEARAREQVHPGAQQPRLVAVVHAPNTRRADRYRSAGFTPMRHFWRMTTPLPAVPLEHPPANGVTIRPYGGAAELPLVHRVLTDAFRGHFRSVPLPYDEWAVRYGRHAGEGGGPWLLAELDGEVVGALLSASTVPGLGWIRAVGVLAPARGHGAGLALLRRAFDDFTALGATKVSLGVDAENATGAVALYERAGMSVERRFDFYEKPLLG